MAIFMGGTPIGAPLIGWVGETYGAPWTIAIGGIAALCVSAVALVYVARTHHLSVTYRRAERPHLLLTTAVRDGATQDDEQRDRVAARRRMAADHARDTASAA
jgi:hypothetical protein